MFSLYLRKVAKVTSNLKSPFKVCSFPSYFFLFFPNFSFSIGILKFVANMFFCGLLTMWSLWGYGWLGFGLFVREGFSRIINFLLHIYVIQILFYICVLPVQFVYISKAEAFVTLLLIHVINHVFFLFVFYFPFLLFCLPFSKECKILMI